MKALRLGSILLCVVSLSGCALMTSSKSTHAPADLLDVSANSVASEASIKGDPSWDWVLAIPNGAPRAELVQPIISNDLLTQLLPRLPEDQVRIVSHVAPAKPAGDKVISQVNGNPVNNWGQLLDASDYVTHDTANRDEKVEVVLVDTADPANSVQTVGVSSETLAALVQSAAANETVIRVSDGGNSAIVIRENGIQCKVSSRIERHTGVLHLILSMRSALGENRLLPVDVRASCNGQPLNCLTVSETLESLYGDKQKFDSQTPVKHDSFSFASVSEREDYLIPANYKRLQKLERSQLLSSTVGPALATVPGVQYPGPAILGDARALTSFLLQRQYVSSTEQSTGWVVFAGDLLRSCSSVDLDLDLGNGVRRIRFTVPNQ